MGEPRKALFHKEILQNIFLYVPNLLEKCDMDELIYEITESRKLFISSGLKDERHCPLPGIEQIENRVASSNLVSIKFNDVHKFNDSEKEAAYKFLDDNLK